MELGLCPSAGRIPVIRIPDTSRRIAICQPRITGMTRGKPTSSYVCFNSQARDEVKNLSEWKTAHGVPNADRIFLLAEQVPVQPLVH